jgi:hypothetical protein
MADYSPPVHELPVVARVLDLDDTGCITGWNAIAAATLRDAGAPAVAERATVRRNRGF